MIFSILSNLAILVAPLARAKLAGEFNYAAWCNHPTTDDIEIGCFIQNPSRQLDQTWKSFGDNRFFKRVTQTCQREPSKMSMGLK